MSLWKAQRWPERTLGAATGPAPPLILLYHSISKPELNGSWSLELRGTDPFGIRVSPRNFAEHMAVLREHCHPMPLVDLQNRLESAAPVTSFAYPFGSQGDYCPQAISLVQECGFQRACINV
jgi:hypothetical protein